MSEVKTHRRHLHDQLESCVFSPTDPTALDAAFDAIIRDLRTQYLIAYFPKYVIFTKEPFHRVDVKTNGPDLTVTTKLATTGRRVQPLSAISCRQSALGSSGLVRGLHSIRFGFARTGEMARGHLRARSGNFRPEPDSLACRRSRIDCGSHTRSTGPSPQPG